MPRLMSFALTQTQLLDGSKTVTRRLGWENLRPGQRLQAVRKAMGLKPGEHPEVLCEIEVVSVRRERLDAIDAADCAAEGFPNHTPEMFISMFCDHMPVTVTDGKRYDEKRQRWVDITKRRRARGDDLVTRIEFRRVVP